MIRVIGIIAEYNPFHNGHLWHFNKSRELCCPDHNTCYTVAVISGNFVQRGEAALFDKWSRAVMAVKAGVDLVLELPFVFSVRSAQYFAQGGVRLLENLGVVTHLSFGAENADLNLLSLAADKIDCPDTITALRQNLKLGKTYAAALSEALSGNNELTSEILSSPNNILAFEYLRAIRRYAPCIIPLAVPRRSAGHHEEIITGQIASANAIRKQFLSAPDNKTALDKIAPTIPSAGAQFISELLSAGCGPADYKKLENIILAKLRSKNLKEISVLPEVGEGLHFKMAQASLKASSIEELLTLLKSKRYPRTRLQRILIHLLFDASKQTLECFDETGPLYARVLAFNKNGRILLKEINCRAKVPVISKTAEYLTTKERSRGNLTPPKAMLSLDTLASDIYALTLPAEKFKTGGADFLNSPKYI